MINERYLIKKKIGEGRSRVFLCTDTHTNNDAALKILPHNADPDEVKTFREEFFTLRKLDHPNIPGAFETGTVVKSSDNQWDIINGSRYFSLEHFEGVELLQYPGLWNEDSLREIIKQVCSVLYYLHQSNYIYYDLKPENILVTGRQGKPFLKLIDLGLARHVHSSGVITSRGTPEYISPEVLNKMPHDQRSDLYSLGILLYRIVYGRFPFETSSELEIYKAHIEKEFAYPACSFSEDFVDVIKKLLRKDPAERYFSSLNLLEVLGIPVDEEISDHFLPAKIFTGREEILIDLKNFISDKAGSEVYLIKGYEGSGKTSLLNKIYSAYPNVVFAGASRVRRGIDFITDLFKKIIFTDFIYPKLDVALLDKISLLFSGRDTVSLEMIKSVMIQITSGADFILLLDDFNSYDNFSLEILKDLIPILQVNKIKVVITENPDLKPASGFINNLKEINLTPFGEKQVDDFLRSSFAPFFPSGELKKLIMLHADLLPGSIETFLKDLLLLRILNYDLYKAEIEVNELSVKMLRTSYSEIYNIRLEKLTEEEFKLSLLLSSFDINPIKEIVAKILDMDEAKLLELIPGLQAKNIIESLNTDYIPAITSEGLKKYIYSLIDDKEIYHRQISEVLEKSFPDYSNPELARQYELSGKYHDSCRIWRKELEEADKISAYSYKRKILQHLLEMPLGKELKFELKTLLAQTCHTLGDPKSSLEIIKEMEESGTVLNDELFILKGICLAESGDNENGKKLLESLLPKITDEISKQRILFEIAYAEYELGNYDKAKKVVTKIINNESSSEETKGKCFNLLALLNTHQDNNLKDALDNFKTANEIYKNANLLLNVAKTESNIGTTYLELKEYENAEKHWNYALQSVLSTGNLTIQATILISLGIFHYKKRNFEKSRDFYMKAMDVCFSIGDVTRQGVVLLNISELHLVLCEYQNAFETIQKSRIIFKRTLNVEMESEVLFILGKFYFIIGNTLQLEQVVNDYSILINKNGYSKKQHNKRKYLIILIKKFEYKIYLKSFKETLNSFIEINEIDFFTDGCFVLCEILLKNNLFEEAFLVLQDEKYMELSKHNKFVQAERIYLLSKISSKKKKFNLPNSIDLLLNAYDIIKTEHITELTWKVLYELTENYFNRGNANSAEEYLNYTKEVIAFIAGNIKNEDLKQAYLSKPEIKSALQRLERIKDML